jgi:murein hydrolase activator
MTRGSSQGCALLLCTLAAVVGTGARAQESWGDRAAVAATDPTLASAGEVPTLRARKAHIESELASARGERAAVETRLARDVRALYRLQRTGLLPVAGGLSAMLGHASRVGRLERVVSADANARSALAKRVGALEGEHTTVTAQLTKAEHDDAVLQAARAKAERQTFMSAFTPRAPEAAAPSARQWSGYGLSVVAGGGGGGGERFAEQKGRLALPVAGAARIEETQRAESDGPGLALSSDRGTSVRAVAQGRVVFAERYGSYGQLVVVDHGDRYFTVYGGLSEVEVQVGDEVSKSARLGTSGSEPVYFEVRRGTRAQDARAWLGL